MAMGIVDDILKALDRIPIWKRLQGVPEEVDDLARRVAKLEEKLGDKWPADVCKFCGERALRLANSFVSHDHGKIENEWKCETCGEYETRFS